MSDSKHPLFKSHIERASRFQLRKPTPKKNNWETFYKLSSNENLLGPSPLALKAMKMALENIHEYDHYDDLQFQNTLSEFYGQQLKPGQFITANSGVEVLEIICRGLISVGSECIISSPTFSPYKNMIELEGGVVVDVPLTNDDFQLDVDEILKQVNRKTALLFLTNPNNPTGTYASKDKIDYLLDRLPEHIIVVYDEVYFHFVDQKDFPYAIDYVKAGKNLIGLHTFSKIYGLAGLRVGYGFTNPVLGNYLNKIFRPFRIGTLPIVAATAALKDRDHLKRSQEMVWKGRKFLYNFFDEMGIEYLPTQGNFILFVSPIPSLELAGKMLDEGVMIRPGDNFGAPGYIRLTIGTPAANRRFAEVFSRVSVDSIW